MAEYADDGLPLYYYEVLANKNWELDEMRIRVRQALSQMDVDTSAEITEETMCDHADISPLFSGEVGDFIEEWRRSNERND